MSVRYLEKLFRPRSVAVIGASTHPDKLGHVIMRNLLEGGLPGPVLPVNPSHASVHGVLSYRSVAELPVSPDLAAVATPAALVPGLLEQLGSAGTKVTVVLADPAAHEGPGSATEMIRVASEQRMRLMGPSSMA